MKARTRTTFRTVRLGKRIIRIRGKAEEASLRDDPLILMRHMLADRWHVKLVRDVFKVLKSQTLEAADRAAAGAYEVVTDRMEVRWIKEMAAAKRKPVVAMVNSSIEVTKSLEFGKKSMDIFPGALGPGDQATYINDILGKQAGVAIEGVGYDSDDIFLHRAQTQDIEAYIQATSKVETETTRKELDKIFKDANEYWDPVLQRGLTPTQVAKQIRVQGLARSRTRANLISRTTTMWSYNEGAHQTYLDAGVQAEAWVASHDDVLCEFCVQMDGQMVRTEDPFLPAGTELPGLDGGTLDIPTEWSISHPPLHPMCRCVVVPVIVPSDARMFLDAGDKLREDYTQKVQDGTLKEARNRRATLLRRRRKPKPTTKQVAKPKKKVKKKPAAPKEQAWKPAKTKKDAVRWAENEIIDPKSPFVQLGDTVQGYEKLPMESINLINNELTGLVREYGVKLDSITAKSLGVAEADTFASMGTHYKNLELNAKYWKRLDAFGKHVARQQASGWSTYGTAREVLVHEYGHALLRQGTKGLKLVKNAFRVHNKVLAEGISRYAAVKPLEMWAEIFVKYHRGDVLPRWARTLVKNVLTGGAA